MAGLRPGGTVLAGVAAAFLGGVGGAVQARVNGGLAAHLHDGVAAALISNGSALLILTGAMLAAPAARAGLRLVLAKFRGGTLRLWECLGGVCGALYVAGQGISAGALGVAVFTVAVVAGQSSGGLLADAAGLTPGGKRPVTRVRAAGATLTVAAALVAVGGRLQAGAWVPLALLPLVAGAGLAFQGAVNGRVRQAAGAVLPAVYVNALTGTAGLLVAFGMSVLVRGRPTGALPATPWLYLGGVLGIGFTTIGVMVVRRIGVLLLALGVIAGQLAGAVALDVLAPGPAGVPGMGTLLGAGLTLLAVMVIVLPDLKGGREPSPK
jgi:bacterial/archaeal transporter family-2 protein